ncbi:MAG TPA: hypothetical protein VGF55_07140 [Gemmataceae bacterium]|jgi:hypothetical protein
MRPWFAVIALLAAAGPVAAVDFAALDRRIAREPAYAGKPLYALALLGPEAKVRVWLALDGEKLYVDKNCNGDLTDDGPPAELKDTTIDPASYEMIDASPDGGKTVYEFHVTLWGRPSFRRRADPDAEPFNQSVDVFFRDGRRFGAWGDQHGPLLFAPKREDAPVLHFGGPLRMGFEVRQPLRKDKDGLELSACVGTPGSRPGAWVHLMYDTIPEQFHPRAVLEFPPEKPGGPPVRTEFVLGHRC